VEYFHIIAPNSALTGLRFLQVQNCACCPQIFTDIDDDFSYAFSLLIRIFNLNCFDVSSLINPWMLSNKPKPTIIRDGDGGLRAYPRGQLVRRYAVARHPTSIQVHPNLKPWLSSLGAKPVFVSQATLCTLCTNVHFSHSFMVW